MVFLLLILFVVKDNFWKKGVAFLLCQYLKTPNIIVIDLASLSTDWFFSNSTSPLLSEEAFSVKELIKAHACPSKTPYHLQVRGQTP